MNAFLGLLRPIYKNLKTCSSCWYISRQGIPLSSRMRYNSERVQAHIKGIIARIRRSRGRDIDAACGQLANKNKAAVKV